VLTLPIWLAGSGQRDDAVLVPSHQQIPAGACDASGAADFDITTKDASGADVKLSDYKGKVILLNFWATWCGPCKVEIPGFVEVYNEYKDRGFVIVGVLTDDQPDLLKPFAAEYKMNYPQVLWHDDMDKAYGPVFGLPTSLLITRDGAICRKHMGPVSKERIEQEIAPLL
jgi:thiol-disulfide isomerase/thioredoxin